MRCTAFPNLSNNFLQKSDKVSKFHIQNMLFAWKPYLNYISGKGTKFEDRSINCSKDIDFSS